jgi:hypothetical protein
MTDSYKSETSKGLLMKNSQRYAIEDDSLSIDIFSDKKDLPAEIENNESDIFSD